MTCAKHLVDDDTASHLQPGGLCQPDIRFDSDPGDDDVDGDAIIAVGADEKLVCMPVDALDALTETDADTVFPKIHVQEIRKRTRIDAIADGGSRKDHRHFPPVHGKGGRNLRSDEAAADHRELGSLPCGMPSAPEIGESPEIDYGGISLLQMPRRYAGCQKKPLVSRANLRACGASPPGCPALHWPSA
jgi:hypothetical protein